MDYGLDIPDTLDFDVPDIPDDSDGLFIPDY